jgi:hypothetical protein
MPCGRSPGQPDIALGAIRGLGAGPSQARANSRCQGASLCFTDLLKTTTALACGRGDPDSTGFVEA